MKQFKVGDIWRAECDALPDLTWTYQILAVYEDEGGTYISAAKQNPEGPWGMTFDSRGFAYPEFGPEDHRLVRKLRRKPLFDMVTENA